MTVTWLTLTGQSPAVPAATVALDAPPSDIWRVLADHRELQTALLKAVRDTTRGRALGAFLDALDEAGVDALSGGYATLAARTACGERPAGFDLLRATRFLGRGRSPLEDAHSAARLFALAGGVTPTIEARLDVSIERGERGLVLVSRASLDHARRHRTRRDNETRSFGPQPLHESRVIRLGKRASRTSIYIPLYIPESASNCRSIRGRSR